MKHLLAYAAAFVAVHVIILLCVSWVMLEWQNPLEWTDGQRLSALLASAVIACAGPVIWEAYNA